MGQPGRPLHGSSYLEIHACWRLWALMGFEEFHDRGGSPRGVDMPAGMNEGLNRSVSLGGVEGAILAARLARPGGAIDLAIGLN